MDRVRASAWRAEVPNLGPVQIFTFSCTKFVNFINTGAEIEQYFCAYTIGKQYIVAMTSQLLTGIQTTVNSSPFVGAGLVLGLW